MVGLPDLFQERSTKSTSKTYPTAKKLGAQWSSEKRSRKRPAVAAPVFGGLPRHRLEDRAKDGKELA